MTYEKDDFTYHGYDSGWEPGAINWATAPTGLSSSAGPRGPMGMISDPMDYKAMDAQDYILDLAEKVIWANHEYERLKIAAPEMTQNYLNCLNLYKVLLGSEFERVIKDIENEAIESIRQKYGVYTGDFIGTWSIGLMNPAEPCTEANTYDPETN
jgi:hypothetical protein